MTFGENIKRIRQTIGITQEELASKSGLSAAAISHYEADRREPKKSTIDKLCVGLGCTYNALLDHE